MRRALILALCAAAAAVDVFHRDSSDELFKDWTLRKYYENANSSARNALSSRALLDRAFKCVIPDQYLCPGQEYCCNPGTECFPLVPLGCCPETAQTCGGKYCCITGSSCCPAGGCCDPDEACCLGLADRCCTIGWKCCEAADGCCSPSSTCCPGACCPEGTTCGANYGECQSTSSSTTSTSTIRPTSTATTTTATSSTSCASVAKRALPTLHARVVAPVPLYYPNSPELQDLLANMCIGMRKRGAVQSEELTYLGPKKTHQAEKDQNRKDAGCVGADNDCEFNGGLGDSCDEYPFASTHEGGIDQARCTRAHKRCIPHVQNSKQGRIFNKYLAQLRKLGQPLQPGDKFTMQIDPSFDCTKVPDNFRLARRYVNAPYTGSGSESTVWRPIGNTSDSSYLIVPLGDVADGNYNVDMNLVSGSVTSITIIDNEGEEYATSNQLTASSTANLQFSMLSFTGLGFVGLSAILETDSDATKVGYSYDGTPPLHSGGDDPLPPSTAYRFAPIGSLCAAAFTLGVLLTHV